MAKQKSSFISSVICWCGQQVLRFPWVILMIALVACGFSLQYIINNLGVDTNSSKMLSADLPFQKNRLRLEEAFPQEAATILLVVDAATPEETSSAATKLADLLSEHPERFDSVYIPNDNEFFRRQALLYLDRHELDDLANKLTDAQPFIGYLSQNYGLEGLFSIIGQALNTRNQDLPMDLNPLLLAIDKTLSAQITGRSEFLSWQNLLAVNKLNTDSNRTLVIAKPKMHFDELLPADSSLSLAREISYKLMAENKTLRIRITGETALEHEELESVSNGAAVSGLVSFLLVCLSLWIGLRSVKLLFATVITLLMGLILTAAFAAASVGHLNVISVAFASLFIGLGVDFAVHICLHYREARVLGNSNHESIAIAVKDVGFSLFLCAVTTAIGFLAFIPTDYAGVSELGVISGAGMFIGLLISLIVLPAFFCVLPVNNPKEISKTHLPEFVSTFPFKFAGAVKVVSIILAMGSCFVLTKLTFDSNPINLRDPKTESVSTIKELLKSKTESPFALTALTDNLKDAERIATEFQKLPAVHEVITISSFVAQDQDAKLQTIDDLALILGNQLSNFDKKLNNDNQQAALIKFNEELKKAIAENSPNAPQATLKQLQQRIEAFIGQANASAKPVEQFAKLENNLLGLLPETMQRLQTSLTAEPYGLDDLPPEIKSHWVSKDGLYKVLITPEKDQNQLANLREFVTQVQSVDNTITGLPVSDQASGDAVIAAFIQAFSGAGISIMLLLLIIFRSMKKMLMIMMPLLLSTVLTGATSILLDLPFNFANIIALPLLMGMGVDSGIHIMHRLSASDFMQKNLLQSSTARGVVFSSITTLCSFASLAFISHLGVASMGVLLTIGISYTLFCSLIVLPAFSGKTI